MGNSYVSYEVKQGGVLSLIVFAIYITLSQEVLLYFDKTSGQYSVTAQYIANIPFAHKLDKDF